MKCEYCFVSVSVSMLNAQASKHAHESKIFHFNI